MALLAWAQEVPSSNLGAPTKISLMNSWSYATLPSHGKFLFEGAETGGLRG